MATRASIRFATREEGVSFNELPEKVNAKFYAHWDGYPSHRGVEIAESLLHNRNVDGWEIEDLTSRHTDLEYIYYPSSSVFSLYLSIKAVGKPTNIQVKASFSS